MVKHLYGKRTSKKTTIEEFKLLKTSKKIKKPLQKNYLGRDFKVKTRYKYIKPTLKLKKIDINLIQKI